MLVRICCLCVDTVCASFAVIFNGGGSCLVAAGFSVNGFIFAFAGGQEATAFNGASVVVLKTKTKNTKNIVKLFFFTKKNKIFEAYFLLRCPFGVLLP